VVVDDDPAALKLAEATLRELDYDFVGMRNPEEALRLIHREPPAGVILDLLMPGVDGFEFISRLQTSVAGRRVPVVVWSVKDLDAREYHQLQSATWAIVSKGHGSSKPLVDALQRLLLSTDVPKETHGV